MNKIEEYIDSIYGNFDNSDKDTKILKEEMRNHLYEEVEELKRQGLGEEESISRALECFGEENDVVGEMNYILKIEVYLRKCLLEQGFLFLLWVVCFKLLVYFLIMKGLCTLAES